MKRYIIIIGLILNASYVYSQRHTNNSYVGINCATEVNYYGLYIAPSITSDYKKNTFSIGPLFNAVSYYSIIPKKENYYYPTKQQFIGGRLSYDKHFFSRKNKLNLYLNINFTYHNIVFSEYENHTTKEIEHFDSKAEFLGFYYGLGNNIYYKSGFYLNMGIGWGTVLYEKLGSPPDFSIPDRGYLSNAMVVRLGIGYTIK